MAFSELTRVHVVSDHGPDRIGDDQLRIGRVLIDVFAHTTDGAARSDAEHDRVNIVIQLLEDLRCRGQFVGKRIIGIAELVDEIRTLLLCNALSQVLVILGMTFCNIRACQHDLGAHGAQVENLFLAHLVRQHENQVITLLCRNQRKADAGVAGGRLDERVSGLDIPALLGLLDHRDPDSILDRTAGIHQFEFQEQPARTGIHTRNLEHWRAPDHVEDIGENLHVESRCA